MTTLQFKDWLDRLEKVWIHKNPKAAVDLCAQKFRWYETPFSKPLTTQEELVKEWQGVLDQENIKVNFEILSVNQGMGIAKWTATFTKISTKQKLAYEGIYQVFLDNEGRCIEFREWFNKKQL